MRKHQRGAMTYEPDWESLQQSLTRLVSIGLDEQQVKIDLCNAVADEKIKLRIFLSDEDEELPGICLCGKEIGVPKRLRPADFDWNDSLPTKDWYAGDPNDVNIGWERRKFALVELCTWQVNAIFNMAGAASPKLNSPNNDLAKYSECLALQDEHWVPPASLETALRKIQDLPVVWLNQAVDIMAFGNESAASHPMEFAARRCQASRALCQGARMDQVRAIGNPDRPGDKSEPIPRAYFDIPRQLGSADNSVETALDNISTQEFMIAAGGGHQKWFNVRIETRSLSVWLRGENSVESYMIEPMNGQEVAGYVPLSSALLWIMTDGGSTRRTLQDVEAWNAAVEVLLPLISTGEIEIIGRPANGPPEIIKGSTFAGIVVSTPLHESIDMLVGDDPWISCTPFVDLEHWSRGFNDQVFLYKARPAAWTHLQVKKSDVVRHFIFSNIGRSGGNRAGGIPQLSKVAKAAKFKEWREARGSDVPTIKEDTAYMKGFGVGRDEVRLLRKHHPRRNRGKPKAT